MRLFAGVEFLEVGEFLAYVFNHEVLEFLRSVARVHFSDLVEGLDDFIVYPCVDHHLSHPSLIPSSALYSKNIAINWHIVKLFA